MRLQEVKSKVDNTDMEEDDKRKCELKRQMAYVATQVKNKKSRSIFPF